MNFIKEIWKYPYRPQVYPVFNDPIYYMLRNRGLLINTILGRLPFPLKKRFMDFIVHERIVEIPFVFKNLHLVDGCNLLEIGCTESKVSIELASLGYKVIGYDLRGYEFTHPNFSFAKGDFLNNKFPDNHFDGIIAISTIEHCGLDIYGGTLSEDADKKVVNQVCRVLKISGKFIITVPFGKKEQTPFYRIYDTASLQVLLNNFRIVNEEYYRTIDRRQWLPVKKEQLVDISSVIFVQGVACIVCEKP